MRIRLGRLIRPLSAGLVILVAAGVLACSESEKSSGGPSVTPGGQTALPAATPSPSADIRSVDLANQSDVKDFAQSLNGEVAPEEVIYADLTGDGREDAVVPVSSGGTQGDVGFIVVGYVGGKLKALFSDAPAGGEARVAVAAGRLVETLPVYAEGDPPGFPSSIKNIFYAWKDGRFVVDHEEIVSGPNRPPRP
jgi:hypothetical protein